jgi:acyl-CoA synthetase (NDP forming)
MLEVFRDAGLRTHTERQDGALAITIPLPADDTGGVLAGYLDAVAARERSADVASLRPVFAPRSVAVIGASRRPGTVGRSVLGNIADGGFAGTLYAVNPNAREIAGVTCYPSVLDLPSAPDLAVIAVPPAAVPAVAEDCGKRGVRGLVVLTAGLDTAQSASLLESCRHHGMRLVGPNCFGIAVPALGLDATFAAARPAAGTAGLVLQSGGLGFAMVEHLSRLGIGISSFASVGNKLDVSSNDMLMWWERDGVTKLAVLYIESFGNPRKFARTARRVGAQMPVLTVHAGRSEAGQRAAASHTAAVASPLVSREALFEQAGIVATRGLGELLDAAAFFATQEPPRGRTVAIVGNVGGAGVLAADACTDLGLTVHHPSGATDERLRSLVPPGGAVGGPVDTTATVSGPAFRETIEALSADEEVDAIIALILPTAATGDLSSAITSATVSVPLAAVVLGQAEAVRLLDTPSGRLPAYGTPEAAAAAVARAASYGTWKAGAPNGEVPALPGTDAAAARNLVNGFLAGSRGGGWLPPSLTADLLRCYQIPMITAVAVHSEDEAAEAASAMGYPVVVKADVPGLVHKSDAGAVLLDLRDEIAARSGYRRLAHRFGGRLEAVRVEPMIAGGTEVIVGVADDQVFGPLVVFGLGGVATEVLADHVARFAPLTGQDADTMIGALRSAPLLRGFRGAPAADLTALRDLLMRVSRLADDIPGITDLDLNPVIARPDSAVAVDARIRVAPRTPQDPYLRRLR